MARSSSLIDDARDDLADSFGCKAQDIIFTSGSTESDNLAIFGVHSVGGLWFVLLPNITVLEPTMSVGGKVVHVERNGTLDLNHLSDTINDETTLVSIGLVNGETGVIQDQTINSIVQEVSPKTNTYGRCASSSMA